MSEFGYLSTSYSEPLDWSHMTDRQAMRDEGIPLAPGQKLPNGAIILAEVVLRKFECRRDSMVLCVTTGFQPFVSWIRTIQTDILERNERTGEHNSWFNIKDYCESGDYHSDLEHALHIFKHRVNEKLELLHPMRVQTYGA